MLRYAGPSARSAELPTMRLGGAYALRMQATRLRQTRTARLRRKCRGLCTVSRCCSVDGPRTVAGDKIATAPGDQ
jgi:hypothetical protein